MTKNEKLLVCFLLLFVESKCFRSSNSYSQYFQQFKPQQVNIQSKLSQITSESQRRSQNRQPVLPPTPPVQNYWAYQSSPRYEPAIISNTSNIASEPPSWVYKTTTTTNASPKIDGEWDLFTEKKRTLQHISDNIIRYFMRVAVQDFLTKLLYALKNSKLYIDDNEEEILEERCTMCSVKDLKNYLNTLLIILEKYPPLNGNKTLSGHVATEYERACDILNTKMKQFKFDMMDINTEADFKDLRRKYTRKERSGGIMTLLLDWFELYARDGTDDEENIQKNLIKYIKALKRYWLINIRGIL